VTDRLHVYVALAALVFALLLLALPHHQPEMVHAGSTSTPVIYVEGK
jgi:hypothetical protein